MDVDDARALQSSLREMFAQTGAEPGATVTALRELGWHDVVAQEPTAASLLFEEHGRARAVSRLLDDAVLATVGVESAGTAVAYLLCPRDALMAPTAALDGDRLVIDAVLRTAGDVPETVVVPTPNTMLRIPIRALDPRPISGLDHDGCWSRVTANVDIDTGWAVSPSTPWISGVATGRRLLAAELVGLARATLEIAVDHVTTRRQFGQSLGSFQAVRFRLADAKVAIEAAAEAVRLAFADQAPLSAAVAKALAGTAADFTVRQAAQVCGAMGLTWEFPLHPIVRRSFVLDALLGDAETLRLALGRHVAAAATLPQLDPLAVYAG